MFKRKGSIKVLRVIRMKRKLMILTAIIATTLGMAGTKEDLETAAKNYSSTKNIEKLESDLVNISKQKSDEYTIQAKIELARLKASQNKLDESKKYLNEILNDSVSTNQVKEFVYTQLYGISNNRNERISYLNELAKLNSKELGYKVALIKEYTLSGNKVEADKLFKELTPNLTEEQKILFYNKLAEDYISEKSPNEAITIADLLIALNSTEAKVYGNMYKSYANISLNKLDEAEKFALEAEKLSNNSLESENLLYQIYNSKGDLNKALDKAIILKNATKTQEFYLDVILLAEIAKNTKVVNDTIKELKENKDIKDDVKKHLNILIANGFVNLGYLDGAEDYANKALKDDKNKEANMVLAFVQGSKGNKGLALKYVREAKKDKIEGAEQLEQQILNLK
ncbi:tetratricopeptide repeat protein [Pseudostreptobacillus sp.]